MTTVNPTTVYVYEACEYESNITAASAVVAFAAVVLFLLPVCRMVCERDCAAGNLVGRFDRYCQATKLTSR